MTVKFTFNLGGDPVELTWETVEEATEGLKSIDAELLDAVVDFKQLAMAKGLFASAASARTSKPKSAAPPNKDGVSCVHGAGNHAKGKNQKTGKPYHGIYCAGKRPNQCSPILLAECDCDE